MKLLFLVLLLPILSYSQTTLKITHNDGKGGSNDINYTVPDPPITPGVPLATGVTGILPSANGGTGLTALGTGGQLLRTNIAGTAMEWTDPPTGGTGDMLAENNLSDVLNVGTSRTNLGLGNVTNESKATMFTSPTITGTPVLPSAITVGGNTITFPAVAATLLPNTMTAGVGTSPTASSTVTVTHNLGRIPTIITIYGMSNFLANAAALPPVHSIGVFCSSGDMSIYQRYDPSTITAAEPAATSTVFAIRLDTGVGNFITGVIENVTSTGFDIVFTETGTATAQPYLWKCQ